MIPPWLFVGFITATLIGALLHLLFGGGAGRFLFFLVLAWVGFGAGQVFGSVSGWQLANLGQIYTIPAVLGALLFSLAGYWLSPPPSNANKSQKSKSRSKEL